MRGQGWRHVRPLLQTEQRLLLSSQRWTCAQRTWRRLVRLLLQSRAIANRSRPSGPGRWAAASRTTYAARSRSSFDDGAFRVPLQCISVIACDVCGLSHLVLVISSWFPRQFLPRLTAFHAVFITFPTFFGRVIPRFELFSLPSYSACFTLVVASDARNQ